MVSSSKSSASTPAEKTNHPLLVSKECGKRRLRLSGLDRTQFGTGAGVVHTFRTVPLCRCAYVVVLGPLLSVRGYAWCIVPLSSPFSDPLCTSPWMHKNHHKISGLS